VVLKFPFVLLKGQIGGLPLKKKERRKINLQLRPYSFPSCPFYAVRNSQHGETKILM
jgi:hypothetical protein